MSLWISSTGIACAVGLSAPAAMHAVAAGVSGIAESRFLDNDDDPIQAAAVELLPPDTPLHERISELASAAILDCLGRIVPAPGLRVGLFVGASHPEWPQIRSAWPAQLASAVTPVLPPWLRLAAVETDAKGRTSGAHLLVRAAAALQSGTIDAALICSADSLLSARILKWLDDRERLKLRKRPDALVAGEAAGCLWVVPRTPSRDGTQIAGVGFGRESASPMNDEPLVGTGLADAARAALAQAQCSFEAVDWRMSDATGEDFAFREQVLLLARLLRRPKPSVPLWHPAEFLGTVGAASGVLHIALAAEAMTLGYAPGQTGLVCATDDFGERSAVLLRGSFQ